MENKLISIEKLAGFKATEELRKKLEAQSLKMRKRQPQAWTKTKYRKYAKWTMPLDMRNAIKATS